VSSSAEPLAARSGGGLAPFAAFGLCTLIWSSTFLFIRIGNDSVPPVWAATLRLSFASVLLALIALATRQPWPRGAALRAALWFGVVDFGISLPLLYWGEKVVPSSVAAILFATLPLMTALFARIFGLEPIRPLKLVGAVIGLGGVTILFSSELSAAVTPLPMVAVFLAAATASLAGVLLKRAPGGSPLVTNAIAHAAGAPFCLIVSFALHEPHVLPQTRGGWLSIGYLTIVGSVVAFVTFAWLLQRWTVTRISFIAVIIPVTAAALGALVRHEHLGPSTVLGACIVLAGVSLAIVADRGARSAGH